MPSMKKNVVFPEGARPLGPYSPAIRIGGFIFASGHIGMDAHTGKLVSGGVEAETHQALTNLKAVLEAGGSSLSQVVKTTLFLTNITDFAKVNQIYAEFFTSEPPARSTIQVAALPGGALFEIEAIATV
ncbi:MAG TPA: Rid family detoxifying hydrolase [Anaerolineales bacterium]